MKDATAAATMSDPLMNGWVGRRRWVVASRPDPIPDEPLTDDADEQLELAGQDPLRAWRRGQAMLASRAYPADQFGPARRE